MPLFYRESSWRCGAGPRRRNVWRKDDMQIRLTNHRWPTSIQHQTKTIRGCSRSRVVLLNRAIARGRIACCAM